MTGNDVVREDGRMPMTKSTVVPPVLCMGEAMIALSPVVGEIRTTDRLELFVAGAEANVAIGMAHFDQSVEWFGRLGDDPFGLRVRDSLRARDVVTDRVVLDPDRRTGIYFKDRLGSRSTMYYYRDGSAATGMDATDADLLALDQRRLVHVSGITPALSAGCAALVDAVLATAPAVSFDVNYRAKLWPVAEAAPRILRLARRATIVLVGLDEAQTLWGVRDADGVRGLFPDAAAVVVKDSDIGATEFRGTVRTFVPAPVVEVVEPIGAGDAFAAGYLTGWLAGSDSETCLRLGHVTAAQALGHSSDSPVLPAVAVLDELAARTHDDWASLAFAAGGTAMTRQRGTAREVDLR